MIFNQTLQKIDSNQFFLINCETKSNKFDTLLYESEDRMNSKITVIVSILSVLALHACSVSPGKQIGENGCECLKKSGGNKEKMQECLGLFQAQIMEEMKRQNSLGTVVNKDADEAFQLWKKCSDEVMGIDSSSINVPTMTPIPSK